MLEKELFEYKDYGYIKIKLDNIMNDKNVSTYELSEKSGVRFVTIQKLRQGNITRIDLEVLAKICYMLDCDIADIVTYVKDK